MRKGKIIVAIAFILLFGIGFAAIEIITGEETQAESPSLSNTSGDLNLSKQVEDWVKANYGDTITTTQAKWTSGVRNGWEVRLLDENGNSFYKMRFNGDINDSQETINTKIDQWATFWLEYEYNKANPQDVNKAGRDYSLGK